LSQKTHCVPAGGFWQSLYALQRQGPQAAPGGVVGRQQQQLAQLGSVASGQLALVHVQLAKVDPPPPPLLSARAIETTTTANASPSIAYAPIPVDR